MLLKEGWGTYGSYCRADEEHYPKYGKDDTFEVNPTSMSSISGREDEYPAVIQHHISIMTFCTLGGSRITHKRAEAPIIKIEPTSNSTTVGS